MNQNFVNAIKTVSPIIGKALPESKAKDIMKAIMIYMISKDQPLFFERVNGDSRIVKYNGRIAESILFPKNDLVCMRSSLHTMSGYFNEGSLNKGDYVIDAGAYPGDYTILASRKIGPEGKVFSFEPDPKSRAYLNEMLDRNNVNNVIVLPYALSNKDGKIAFFQSGEGSTIAEYDAENRHLDDIPIEVETTTLDTFFDKRDKARIKVIKMDIEGAEIDAIKGGENFLEQQKPSLAIASYHVMNNGKKTHTKLEDQLAKIGYSFIKTDFPQHLTTYARR